jgi:4-hydroxy-tetrahydrodipicolinate synthase
MPLFQGSGVALVTPFHEDESVNYKELANLIEYQIAGKTDAIVVCGTTGEPVTMTVEERISVIDFVVKQVHGRCPVIAGTGGNCTKTVIELSRQVEALGVDGLLIVTPYYNKATQKGLYEHYRRVACAVSLPIIMYNVPSRTGVNLLPDTAIRLAQDCENIIAMKEASGNLSQVAELMSKADGCLDVYSGNDDQILPILSLGGTGVISVLANIAPRDTHDMVMAYFDGNIRKAQELQLKYVEVIQNLFREVNPIPVKKALEIIGFDTHVLRMPLTEMEAANTELLKKSIQKIDIR